VVIANIVHLDIIQQFLIPHTDEDDQEGHIHFQQDSTLPQNLGVCEYLNICFPGWWIGREAPIAWPPRSLDFSYEDLLTITIPGKTWCIFLHYNSSKQCACPLNKFIQVFKVVKLFLKHPAYLKNIYLYRHKNYDSVESQTVTCTSRPHKFFF
jgi:hypothetical protein